MPVRLLTADELHGFGLEGANPVQDDLERLQSENQRLQSNLLAEVTFFGSRSLRDEEVNSFLAQHQRNAASLLIFPST